VKAYFTASLRGKPDYLQNYQAIVSVLGKMGYKVYSEHILNENAGDIAAGQNDEEKKKFYHELLGKVKEADIVVAEISHPSISVGHEISFAMELNKVVIALHTEGNSSILLEGSDDIRLKMVNYNLDNLKEVLPKAVEEAKKAADVRFNFFVSPKILNYLDWVAQKRMVPRSVFLRDLIEKEIKKDKEFKE
jgi:hypothetical protein